MPYIEQLPSGTWRAIVRCDGVRRSVTAPTKGELKRKASEVMLSLGARPKESATVAEMLTAHLADQAEKWSPTYHHDATAVVDRLLGAGMPFTDRPIVNVTPAVLLSFYRDLSRAGWTRWRVKRLHTVMGTAWQMALTYEWTAQNPCRLVTPPTPETPDVRPPTTDQVAAILAELEGLDLLAVRLNVTLGIRRGDLCGLQWSDFDPERAELLVARSIAYTPGQLHVMPTKSGRRSHRRLALDLPTVALLRRVKAKQTEDAVRAGLPTPVWMMSDDAGVTPWRPDRVSRLFRRVADRVGATGVRLHDLRHYVATSMLEDGESAHDVAGQLGNTPAVVESTYRHWVAGRGRQSVDRRAARLGG